MTEKRFEMKDPNCWGYPITDNKTGKVYNCNSNIWMKELVGVLNALHEDNKQLKQQIKDLYKFVKYDVDNEIDVYPKSILEHLVNILKIIGDVE